MSGSMRPVRPVDIYLFYPNLIGYGRVLLTLLSFCVLDAYPVVFLVSYALAFVLDAADGIVARAFGQCSHFGAIFDMWTDRAATAGLLVVLSHTAQKGMPACFTTLCAVLVFLDIASHFCRTYITLFMRKSTHKDVSESIFSLLRLYYSNRKVMGAFCIGQEFSYLLFYVYCVYGNMWWTQPIVIPLLIITTVLNFLKQVVNVQQLLDGMYHLAVKDAEEREEGKGK
ncbi:phosphatidyltransferase [Trypanosoma theileri]|uniref:CDP-diacylglycerol--inositol 3-phosphatidyltransferase n=1 Tax=Trypanosoma theileri TaxID=67003 RepID=A0A1X0P7E9_9TRYP|nr:phosphatidyltransferase [Trypanosoma theileri]ORC92798.1 phosphatidyltransferase [Trypanosoma theileri]